MSQMQTLTVDPNYLKFIPRPSKERYNEMKLDIKRCGQQIAIIVNQDNVILDGHTRFQICQELNIIPKTEKRTFDSKLEEERFVYSTNVKRRDLSVTSHVELARKIHQIDQAIGKQKRKSNLKQFQKSVGTDFQNSENRSSINVTKSVAEEVGVSVDTASKIFKILDHGEEKDVQALREGKNGISPHKVYRKIRKQEKKKKRQDEIKKIQVNLPETIQLHNKPFQELQIDDDSVSLIFTDPPYTKEFLYLYDEMAKQAFRVLRDGGSLMCYVGHYALNVIIPMIEKHGLTFHHPVAVIHSGQSSKMDYKKVLVGYKLMLWFTKGKYEGEYVKDVIESEFQGKELHEWAQSTKESDYYIKYLTIPNDIVYDPFMGQGTFGISARKLDRQFIGAEINKTHYSNAQKLISAANNIIVSKQESKKKYNLQYKERNRKKLNKKEAQRMKEKREFTKKIRPLFLHEKLEGETFTQFYNRKRKELHHNEL